MRFGSTAKVLLKCKLKYYRISECDPCRCSNPRVMLDQIAPSLSHLPPGVVPIPPTSAAAVLMAATSPCAAATEASSISVTGATVTIEVIDSTVKVLSTKTRPKRLQLLGSDGHTYCFLLKVCPAIPALLAPNSARIAGMPCRLHAAQHVACQCLLQHVVPSIEHTHPELHEGVIYRHALWKFVRLLVASVVPPLPADYEIWGYCQDFSTKPA